MMTGDVFKFRFINGEWTGLQTAHAITLGDLMVLHISILFGLIRKKIRIICNHLSL